MVKPNKFQQARLDELRNLVIEIMTDMDVDEAVETAEKKAKNKKTKK